MRRGVDACRNPHTRVPHTDRSPLASHSLAVPLPPPVFPQHQCNCCVEISEGLTHKCLNQALEGRCPICIESLRTSTKPLKVLACAHVMHDECYKRCRKDRYTCPICNKVSCVAFRALREGGSCVVFATFA